MFPLILFSAAAVQWFLTIWFGQWLQKQAEVEPEEDDSPDEVWAIVCVRGADPSLEKGLQRLLDQSYQRLKVCVVVDHPSDPAHAIIQRVAGSLEQPDRLVVIDVAERGKACSLKCGALATGVEYVLEHDAAARYLVMFDADAGIDREYVSRLLGPLRDPAIGVASGNQWFDSVDGSGMGTMVRSLWYAGAFFFSMLFQNPWAGAFAVRVADARRLGLVEVWRKSAVDDGPLKGVMQEGGLACRSLPQLVTFNRETCTIGFVTRWMTRILTWSKMYEPGFWLTFVQMVFATSLIIGSVVEMTVWPGRGSDWFFFVGAGVLSVFAWLTIRSAVAKVAGNGETLSGLSAWVLFKALVGIPVAQVVYAVACLKAAFSRTVSWRGVNYRIEGKQLRLEEYRAFDGGNGRGHSID